MNDLKDADKWEQSAWDALLVVVGWDHDDWHTAEDYAIYRRAKAHLKKFSNKILLKGETWWRDET